MGIVPLDCANCGAPLEIPEEATFVTCSHCKSRLMVESKGGILYLQLREDVEEIRDGVNKIGRDMEDVKKGVGSVANHVEDMADRKRRQEEQRQAVKKKAYESRKQSIILVSLGLLFLLLAIVFSGIEIPALQGISAIVGVVLLLAAYFTWPKYKGAECPYCHSFRVRRITRSGLVTSSRVLHCDDCKADLQASPSGCTGCGCVVVLVLIPAPMFAGAYIAAEAIL